LVSINTYSSPSKPHRERAFDSHPTTPDSRAFATAFSGVM
jgi:hypothetical protein